MIEKGIFHTNIVVRDLERSLRFYTGLFGMEKTDFNKDGDLVFLTTPGRNDILTLNPSGHSYGFPEGCARESERELKENLPGVQGGMSHFGYMLPNVEEYERVIASVGGFSLSRSPTALLRPEAIGSTSVDSAANADPITITPSQSDRIFAERKRECLIRTSASLHHRKMCGLAERGKRRAKRPL
jgi:catechol 2,3-dioxygenase-like lactoylglutathione lyase family enzyme